MKLPLHRFRSFRHVAPRKLLAFGLLLLALAGCQKNLLPDDPQLRPIQEILDARVPVGTPRANVILFLNTQGYPLESSKESGTIVTTIRKIDTQRLEPVTAHVTFHFDANEKLTSVELQRTLNEPVK